MTLFEVGKSEQEIKKLRERNMDGDSTAITAGSDENRFVRYNFSSGFLRLKSVGAT